MINWAILPVKRFDVGKSRLQEIYSEKDLALINRFLFESTFKKLQNIPNIDRILVISREEQALEWCLDNGGRPLLESDPSSLNAAVSQAQRYIRQTGGAQVLVLPTDLPLITIEDLQQLTNLGNSGRKMVIVPDHYQTGTNAILMGEPDLITPRFGSGSFRKHTHQALKRKAELVVYLNENIQWDLDTSLELCRIIETQSEPNLLSQLRKEKIS